MIPVIKALPDPRLFQSQINGNMGSAGNNIHERMYEKQEPRSACVYTQADLGLRFRLNESQYSWFLDKVWSKRATMGAGCLRWSYMTEGTFCYLSDPHGSTKCYRSTNHLQLYHYLEFHFLRAINNVFLYEYQEAIKRVKVSHSLVAIRSVGVIDQLCLSHSIWQAEPIPLLLLPYPFLIRKRYHLRGSGIEWGSGCKGTKIACHQNFNPLISSL